MICVKSRACFRATIPSALTTWIDITAEIQGSGRGRVILSLQIISSLYQGRCETGTSKHVERDHLPEWRALWSSYSPQCLTISSSFRSTAQGLFPVLIDRMAVVGCMRESLRLALLHLEDL